MAVLHWAGVAFCLTLWFDCTGKFVSKGIEIIINIDNKVPSEVEKGVFVRIGIVITLCVVILSTPVIAEDSMSFDTVVFDCSESIPDPQTLFGEDLGHVMTLRNMGNVVSIANLQPDSVQIASVEYAVLHGAKRVIVLGHSGCRVVQSVIDNPTGKGHLPAIYQVISVSVTKAKASGADRPEVLLQRSIENNVRNSVSRLNSDRYILYKFVQDGSLKIEGYIYNPDTQKAEPIEEK